MSSLRDSARFESEHFAPVLPEDCQVSPGVYGAELAFWVSAELARSGIATSYPNSEDWGWFIEFMRESGSDEEASALVAAIRGVSLDRVGVRA